jgi:transcriptional regulator with XRE-family HTH domain
MVDKSQSPFGQILKYWRGLRGMSQLALAVETGVAARHISFIETGRSRPGLDLVLRLSESLEIPPREQNELIKAAGLPPLHRERELTDLELGPYQRIIDEVLTNHDPYPAFVFDRWWTIIKANRSTELTNPRLAEIGANSIDVFIANKNPTVENYQEVARNLLGHVRSDWARSGHDERLLELMKRLENSLDDGFETDPLHSSDSPAIPMQYKIGDSTLSTIGTIMRFDTARDITLDEIRIELHFPADEPSRNFFMQFTTPSD